MLFGQTHHGPSSGRVFEETEPALLLVTLLHSEVSDFPDYHEVGESFNCTNK